MHRLCLLLILLFAFSVTTCDAGDPSVPAPGGEPAIQAQETEPLGLPAWETAAELAAACKGDEHDDYRAAHPELYGVTAPPWSPVRSFAEYEPAQAMMLRPGGGISSFHRGILKGAAGHVPLIMVFHEPGQREIFEDVIQGDLGLDLNGFRFLDVEKTDAIWTRDYGPVSHVTADGEIGFVDFRYYHGRHWDDAIPTKLAAELGINVFRPSLSYEGGNFMADTAGTCYATEKIYQQNAGHIPAEIDQWMLEYAGCQEVVSLVRPKGLGTGHIDMFCKLMDEHTIILGEYDPALCPENAQILDDNAALLEALTTVGGASLDVVRIPLPWDDTGVWYTYTNSLILNDAVLVPVFSKFKDLEAQALAVYEAAAPHLEILTVNADSIISSGGAIHCVTMTVPEGALVAFQEAPVQICPLNELNKCGDIGPCGGLPYEGACDEDVLQYCGSDEYPHAMSCDECCGWDAAANDGAGWYDCLTGAACAACTDECEASGDKGCSTYLTHAWTCGHSDDDPCLDREYEPCTSDAVCNVDIAECQEGYTPPDPCDDPPCDDCEDECEVVGARTCDDAYAAAWVCREDAYGCRLLDLYETCEAGAVCEAGICVTHAEPTSADLVSEEDIVAPEPSSKGGSGCAAGGEAAPGWWVLLLVGLVCYVTIRYAGQSQSPQDEMARWTEGPDPLSSFLPTPRSPPAPRARTWSSSSGPRYVPPASEYAP